MKFKVNQDCIGCGLCEATCPNVFHLTEEGFAKAIHEDVRDEELASAIEAKNNCPVSAIESE